MAKSSAPRCYIFLTNKDRNLAGYSELLSNISSSSPRCFPSALTCAKKNFFLCLNYCDRWLLINPSLNRFWPRAEIMQNIKPENFDSHFTWLEKSRKISALYINPRYCKPSKELGKDIFYNSPPGNAEPHLWGCLDRDGGEGVHCSTEGLWKRQSKAWKPSPQRWYLKKHIFSLQSSKLAGNIGSPKQASC